MIFFSTCYLAMLSGNMFKKFLVADQFRNKIAVQIKIPIQMDFHHYLKKPRKISSVIVYGNSWLGN